MHLRGGRQRGPESSKTDTIPLASLDSLDQQQDNPFPYIPTSPGTCDFIILTILLLLITILLISNIGTHNLRFFAISSLSPTRFAQMVREQSRPNHMQHIGHLSCAMCPVLCGTKEQLSCYVSPYSKCTHAFEVFFCFSSNLCIKISCNDLIF